MFLLGNLQSGSKSHSVFWSMGTSILSLGVELLGRETDHSLSFSRSGAFPPLPQYAFMWLHGDNLTSYSPWFNQSKQYKNVTGYVARNYAHLSWPSLLYFSEIQMSSHDHFLKTATVFSHLGRS